MALAGGLTRLTLPQLPKLGGRVRKPKQPRPEYSVDIQGERRERPRISIEELSQRGADILKEHAPDLPKTDQRSLFTKVTDILDIPRNFIANAIASIAGAPKEKLREGTLQKTVYMSDVLSHLGVPAGPLRSIIGFVGDVAIDPLTYASLAGGAGIKIAKGVPRIVGPAVGMVKTAAKTGKAAPELAKVLQLRKGLPAIFEWLTARYGAARAAKMLGKGDRMLAQRIKREVVKGAPEALGFLAKYGEKARPLFRLPFAAKGIGEVLPGARKAAYKGVQEAIAHPEASRHIKTAERMAVGGKRVVREMVKGIKAAEKDIPARVASAIAEMKAKHSLSTIEEANLTRMLTSGFKAKAKEAIKPLAEKAIKAKKLATAAKSELTRFTTSPEAPGIIRQMKIAEMGKPLIRGEQGIIPTLTRLKQKVFGAPVTSERQRVVAIHQQLSKGAAAAKTVKIAIEKQLSPIIKQYVVAGKGTEDEIGRLIYRLAEAGPELSNLKTMPLTDALRKSITKAQQIGLADDPAIKKVLADVWQMGETTRRAKGVTRGGGAIPRLLEKPSKQLLKEQKLRVTDLPYRPERATLLTWKSPTGETDKFLSTGVDVKDKIARMKSQGWKQTASEAISTEQMNLMAPQMTRFGPEKAILETAPAFKESLSEAAGSLASQRQRAIGEKMLTDFLKPYAVQFPKGKLEAAKGYGHLARLTPRSGDNPLYQLLQRAGMTKDVGYPVQIANMADDLTAVWNKPEMVEALLKGSDKILGIWKGFQLYHPAYLIRNVFQNLFGGLMAGANPASVVKQMSDKRVRMLTNALATGDDTAIRGIVKRVGGKDVPLDSFYNLLKNYNAANVGQTAAQVPKWKGPLGIVHRINTSIENQMRIATFMAFADKGMDMKSAFMQTLKAMPDLTDLTLFEREGLARLFPWYRWCLPMDCRILTKSGWKTADELKVGELALTYNVEKDISEWQPVEDIGVFPYDGTLLTIGHKLDEYAFTPEHRWPVVHNTTKNGKDVRGCRKIVRGYQLRAKHRIPRNAPHTFNDADETITPREAALIGWIVGDGYMRCRTKGNGSYPDAVIYQKKQKHFAAIRKLLGNDARKESIDEREYANGGCGTITFTMSASLARRLYSLCPDKAGLVGFVTKLTREAATAMWDAMMAAEGSIHPRAGQKFSQNYGPVLHAFQILSIMLGKTAHTPKSADSQRKEGEAVGYCYLSDKRNCLCVKQDIGHRRYVGRVWCPTTANGTWFMERNGRVIITGNCRRNGGLQMFTYLPQKPAYAAMLPRFKNFAEGFRGKDNVPDELRPMWQDEQAAMQITGGKEAGTTFLAQTWFPFEEMYQLLGAPIQPEESIRRLVSSARPGLKAAAEMATGQDIFRRTPREPIGGIVGVARNIPQALRGTSGTALDTLLALRPIREWGPGGRVAQMPTLGAGAQRAVLGGALQPVEYQKGLRAKYWELENEQRRLRALINRAEQAGDQALAASLTRQWTAIIQQMHRWNLPLPKTLEQKLRGMKLPQPGPP